MKLLVGLGNPGVKYIKTRHNAGFLLVESYAKHISAGDFSYNKKFDAQISEVIHYQDQEVIIVKPQTYMNLSGRTVKAICIFYKIKLEDILVVHDEIDLPVGQIKYKDGGSHAGHNGLKSIIHEIGTNNFNRIRIGVGRPNNEHIDISDYVLSPFMQSEREEIESKQEYVETLIDNFIAKNLQNEKKQIL